MEVTTQEPSGKLGKSRDRALGRIPGEASNNEKFEEGNSEEKRSDTGLEVFELVPCLQEALGEWRRNFPKTKLIENFEQEFNDLLVGEADILQALTQALLKRISYGVGEQEMRLSLRRDHLFSSETHVAFTISVEELRKTQGTGSDPNFSPPERAGMDQELSVCRQLIQRLGGELRVETLKTGALRITARLRFAIGSAPLSSSDELLEGVKVLIVDDDSMSRMLTASMLRTLKGQVVTARNGEEAIALAKAQEFDMIFLDIEMPIMDGVGTCEALRQIPSYDEVPILALTSHEHEEQHTFYLTKGMQDVMVKPLNKNTICLAVEKYLLGRSPAKSTRREGARWSEEGSRQALNLVVAREEEVAETFEGNYVWIEAAQLRDAFDESREVLELCITVFAKRYPVLLEEIELAIKMVDSQGLSRAAHELKGMLANLWTPRLCSLAAAIEDSARQGRTQGTSEKLLELRECIPYCVEELKETVKTWPEEESSVSV